MASMYCIVLDEDMETAAPWFWAEEEDAGQYFGVRRLIMIID